MVVLDQGVGPRPMPLYSEDAVESPQKMTRID